MAGTRVTMRDVARASGVSAATVSFVLNDVAGQTISTETRERVRRAAAELGYAADPLARALREGGSRIVVLETGRLPQTPVLEGLIDGAAEAAAASGHELLVARSGSGPARAVLAGLRPRAVVDLEEIQADPAREGGWMSGMPAHFHTQLAFLRDRGHSRVAIAVPAGGDPLMRALEEVARRAAARAGVGLVDAVVVGDDLAQRLRSVTREVSAVAALDDEVALDVLAAAVDADIRVPDELAVIGWGDLPFAARWRPALTSVRIDAPAYGRALVRSALGLADAGSMPGPAVVVTRDSA